MGQMIRRSVQQLARWVWVIVLVCSLASVGIAYKGIRDYHKATECQTKQFKVVVDNLKLRSQISTQGSNSITEFLNGVVDAILNPPPGGPAEQNARISELGKQYNMQQKAVDDFKAANPIPALESPCSPQHHDADGNIAPVTATPTVLLHR